MRFELTLQSNFPSIILPIQHNELIQAAIYSSLSTEFSRFLHDHGYQYEEKQFKLFVFSRIIGNFQLMKEESNIRFANPVKLIISSPISEFIHEIAQLMVNNGFRIGSQHLRVVEMKVDRPVVGGTVMTVQTMSPIVVYSTLRRTDDSKYTVYFEPAEVDFQSIASANLLAKGKILYGESTEFLPVQIKPIGQHKRHVVKYKSSIIKGYSGRFLIQGDKRLLQTALDTGIGSKNSMGFGLVDLLPARI